MITVDAMKKISETDQIPLTWVGMEKIILPAQIMVDGVLISVAATFDVFVNLVNPSKGIHMSRLYEILSQHTRAGVLSLNGVRELTEVLVHSQGGLSTHARVQISLSLPILTSTLKSERNYFKSVPLEINFVRDEKSVQTEIRFQLDYSSTCPQSAALAQQLTVREINNQNLDTAEQFKSWFAERGFVATPHAQRSELHLTAQVNDEFEINDFSTLFTSIGACLGTPTQGLVKREDEQEFARLNASNLMFCEDAARKLVLFLKQSPMLASGSGKVSHLESLHSHNAAAYFKF